MTDHTAEPGTGTAYAEGFKPTIITGHAFAPYWLEDLLRESEGEPPHAVRRGVVAAAAFLENYWFHWAQNVLLSRGERGESIVNHFSSGTDAWRVPPLHNMWRSQLERLNLQPLTNGDTLNTELERLAKWRHSLMHGRTSRLRIDGPEGLAAPDLTLSGLEQTSPRWPLDVALACVRHLHHQSQSDPPRWIAQYLTKPTSRESDVPA